MAKWGTIAVIGAAAVTAGIVGHKLYVTYKPKTPTPPDGQNGDSPKGRESLVKYKATELAATVADKLGELITGKSSSCELAFKQLPEKLSYVPDTERKYGEGVTVQQWARDMMSESRSPIEKWVASRILAREADAMEAAAIVYPTLANPALASAYRKASACIVVAVDLERLSPQDRKDIHLVDLPGTMYQDTIESMKEPGGGTKSWSDDSTASGGAGLNVWKNLKDSGYLRAAYDFRVLYYPLASLDPPYDPPTYVVGVRRSSIPAMPRVSGPPGRRRVEIPSLPRRAMR